MKKIIIKQIDDRLIAYVDDIEPKLNLIGKSNVFATFDVSEVNIHC